MSNSRKQIWIALIAVPPCLLLAAILGLQAYMNATAKPVHADPNTVPSLMQSPVSRQWADAAEQGRQFARANLTAQNLPGLSVAVGANGSIAWAEGFGFADVEKRVPVGPDMRFRIGGASMALTSAAVGLLLENDRLNLDADIQKYVPTFPEKQWPVTLRQLMGHLAGVRQDAGDEEPLSEDCELPIDGLQRFAQSPLLFQPGTRYKYSTYGWILVSAAVEAAAHEPFLTFMSTRIFMPLSMRDTTPDSGTEPIPDRATFYYPRFRGDPRYGLELAREGDYSCFAGAGAFLSTASDLVRFGMAINTGKVLQPATVRMLQSPQRLASGEETGYGLGWQVEPLALAGQSTTMAGHDGGYFIGGSTSLLTFPERGIVVAVTANVTYADTRSIALKIAQAFADRRRSPAPR